jgi:hypothetical protein
MGAPTMPSTWCCATRDPTQMTGEPRHDRYHPNAASALLPGGSIPLSIFGERAQQRSSDACGLPAVVGLEGT